MRKIKDVERASVSTKTDRALVSRIAPWTHLALIALALMAVPASAEPVFSDGGPDADAYGKQDGYPVGRAATARQQRFIVGSFSHYDELVKARLVTKPPAASPLSRAEGEFTLGYAYAGSRHTLDDYLARHPTTGLLIAKGDTILTEHYQYARNDRHRFASQSMAKTVIAMLLGIALDEKAIRSIDDKVETYVPELAGSEYGSTPLRALLTLSSGVAFTENYDGHDDISKLIRDLFRPDTPGVAAAVKQFNTRIDPPGTTFRYASIETEILGLVLRRATGVPVADYLREKIWHPLGAEADASWLVDGSGQEATFCCLNAVLRDYARLGLMLAHNGFWNGLQIVPRQWLLDATSNAPADTHLKPARKAPTDLGYGYQVWLSPGTRHIFSLRGVHGQAIYVDPRAKLVLVHTAVRLLPRGDPAAAELAALWRALVAQHGGT
jgi:CubicO group peptidase (beta-lactamase class C family)